MRNILKIMKKNWITVWLVTAVLLSGTFVTYAAYRKVTAVKRVVTTQSSPQVLFSSNCMLKDIYGKKMASNQFTVTVCNYDQSNHDIVNPDPINYKFTAQLLFRISDTEYITLDELHTRIQNNTVDITADEYADFVEHAKGYSIKQTQNDTGSGTIADGTEFYFYNQTDYKVTGLTTQSLAGKQSSTDKFLVTIPQGDIDDPDPKFFVLVQAEPQGDSSLPEIIHTRLYGSKNVVVTASWDGNLVEQNTDTKDYDFYNYVITGSGSGKLDIMWNPDYFDVSDFFFNTALSGVRFYNNITEPVTINDSTSDYNGWKKVTIEVNSTDISDGQGGTIAGRSRYELQLYKVKSNTPYIKIDDAHNYDASKHIDCKLQNESSGEGE